MKQITPAQHFATTTKKFVVTTKFGNRAGQAVEFERFAKPVESQADAIKRLMRQIKAKTNKVEARQFPKDSVSLACTKNYVETFYRFNGLGTPPFTDLATCSTTWPESQEVEFSEEPELATQE